MARAAGRAWMTAGGGLGQIGQLLLASSERAKERGRRSELDELQKAIQLKQSGLIEGNLPVNVELPEVQGFRAPPDPTAAPMPGMGVRATAQAEPGGLEPDAFAPPTLDAVERIRPGREQVKFTPSPDHQQVTEGYHSLTPEAEAAQAVRVQEAANAPRRDRIRNHIGALAAGEGRLDTPEAQDAYAALTAEGVNAGPVMQAAGPQAPVPGTPEAAEWERTKQRIAAEFRSKGEGQSMARESLIALRQMVSNTQRALENDLRYHEGEMPAERRDAIVRAIGPWRSHAEYREAADLVNRRAADALGATPPDGPGIGGGMGTSMVPLSEADKSLARRDPGYAQWLASQGYSSEDWQ